MSIKLLRVQLFACIPIVSIFLCVRPIQNVSRGNSTSRSSGFSAFCKDGVFIKLGESGLSSVDLKTGRTLWSVLPNKIADVGPSVSGDTVAIITESFNTIYAFSRKTGKLLWQRDHPSNVLDGDDRFFYVSRDDLDGISALDNRTGTTAWTLRVPASVPKTHLLFLKIHGGRLYTDRYVISLHDKKVLKKWPQNLSVEAVSFPGDGETLVGDSSGNVVLYDHNFFELKRLHLAEAAVVGLGSNDKGILLASQDDHGAGEIKFVSWQGETKWHVGAPFGTWLSRTPFIIDGNNALILEPTKVDLGGEHRYRLVSRKLATGETDWATHEAHFSDEPAICGDTVFVRTLEGQIMEFNARDGHEKWARTLSYAHREH
ncbi:MAG TPA: PQQ-binding-like beta-propeller repeat protein [Candidatus Angelobacter sp.]|jgi:outer membrane protein assembly factor BamB|nr:PQQ-binding-like beta-propeller repeat protein [Candidatus Angelobacter sp.]